MSRSVFTIAAAALLALALTGPVPAQRADETGDRNVQKQWAAVALGRVEPRSREIRLAAATAGRIIEVLVKPNDTVFAGEILVRLDDVEAHARVVMAAAQAGARERVRDDQSAPRGSGERRRAEDAFAEAEQGYVTARDVLDAAVTARRADTGTDEAILTTAREQYAQAHERLRRAQGDLSRIRAGASTPLPNRTEADWLAGRAELTIADAGLERTRIRAPIDGTVLQVAARAGEMATPTAERPLVVLGDLSGLRVRAELDERDIGQVRAGQAVTVRANAFPGRDFQGSVAAIAQTVGPGGMTSRGPRRQSDIDVLEVTVDLADPGPLKVGMQVDVYFSRDADTPR
ncbi:MAG: efflux RND transporter periplasmic adaptor subunit [Rhodoplanes sp.]|uniref:HlyD family secretion protein n=1 Tax=Rhodoplanes sp. TaxID=1968906 RepID=UPI0017CF1521|nr:efflux RND transporter periplasmic adaptor subunit [Rhodoplanes sp.]NVO15391.1 efflux RND transporter periplasmic adaptor subunit [Rhodoplanes sp.]